MKQIFTIVGLFVVCAFGNGSMGHSSLGTEEWRQQREQSLRAPDGWLSVIALAWLNPGANTIGTKVTNSIVLPAGSTKTQNETLTMDKTMVFLEKSAANDITVNDAPVTARTPLRSDKKGNKEDIVRIGRLLATVIDRSGRLGLRIKDPESPERKHFAGLQWFDIKNEWQVVAKYRPVAKPYSYKNVIGQTLHSENGQGELRFILHGQEFRLLVEGDAKKEGVSIVFNDLSNGKTTYGGGRFLDTEPFQGTEVDLDFNRAYNPPCAFTKYATCPLAPSENHLKLAVEAGEKRTH
jgi:uncharacterized protein (DUF1684 family)